MVDCVNSQVICIQAGMAFSSQELQQQGCPQTGVQEDLRWYHNCAITPFPPKFYHASKKGPGFDLMVVATILTLLTQIHILGTHAHTLKRTVVQM